MCNQNYISIYEKLKISNEVWMDDTSSNSMGNRVVQQSQLCFELWALVYCSVSIWNYHAISFKVVWFTSMAKTDILVCVQKVCLNTWTSTMEFSETGWSGLFKNLSQHTNGLCIISHKEYIHMHIIYLYIIQNKAW